MSEQTAPHWAITSENGPATSQVVITLHPPQLAVDRDQLLTRGVVETMTALVQAYQSGRPVVLDLRPDGGINPGVEAFIEAIRGLAQSFVLEIEVPVRPVNIVVSTTGQEDERTRTLDYLSSHDGTFSCGATYDLREEPS